jgi:large subunit ribosomal protein L16
VSKCGFHIVKKRDVLYPKRTKYSKSRKGRCSKGCESDGTQLGFGRYGTKSCRAGRLSPLKQRVGLQPDNSIVL